MPVPAVNLLPPELRRKQRRSKRMSWVAAVALLAFALLAYYDVGLLREGLALRQRSASLAAEAAALAPSAARLKAVQAEEGRLRDRQKQYESLRGTPWHPLWDQITEALPAGVSLTAVTAAQDGLTLSGTASSLSAVAAAEEALSGVPGVKGAEARTLRGAGSGVSFELDLSLAGRGVAQ